MHILQESFAFICQKNNVREISTKCIILTRIDKHSKPCCPLISLTVAI